MTPTTDTAAHAGTAPPAFCSIDEWCRMSGMGRRWTYDKLATGELVAVKVSSRVLIDVAAGIAWLRAHPAPRIRPSHPAGKRAERAAA